MVIKSKKILINKTHMKIIASMLNKLSRYKGDKREFSYPTRRWATLFHIHSISSFWLCYYGVMYYIVTLYVIEFTTIKLLAIIYLDSLCKEKNGSLWKVYWKAYITILYRYIKTWHIWDSRNDLQLNNLPY